MTQSPIDLLRLLSSGIRPDGATTAGRAPIEHAEFADLLSRVRNGGITSGEPITVAPNAGVELSADQLDRLGVAIDAAQAAGKDRILALIDGLTLSINVESRTVEAAHGPSDAQLLTDFDAVVSVPAVNAKKLASLFSATSSPRPATSPLAALSRIENHSISELLESQSANPAADAA